MCELWTEYSTPSTEKDASTVDDVFRTALRVNSARMSGAAAAPGHGGAHHISGQQCDVLLRSTPDVIAARRAAPLICLKALGTYHQSAGRAQRGGLAQRSGANPIKAHL